MFIRLQLLWQIPKIAICTKKRFLLVHDFGSFSPWAVGPFAFSPLGAAQAVSAWGQGPMAQQSSSHRGQDATDRV